MRLLDLVTGDFVDFLDLSTAPPYAILSHRWDQKEQTYQDIREIQNSYQRIRQSFSTSGLPRLRSNSSSQGDDPQIPSHPFPPPSIWDSDSGLSDKVRGACEAARKDGFRYLWIDSCCIDKTSSSELSESINSMFAWYRDAAVCYAFLSDVPTLPPASLRSEGSAFRSSVWFTRGWTLQELIAPHRLVFFSQAWEPLGTKSSLAKLVEEITSIPVSVLTGGSRGPHQSLDECSVAQRMSWAANRQTTKVEDQAYSLLGIFDIEMSTLYGEGERAFRRLQEEILRRIPDQTIFAWGTIYPDAFPKLIASSGPDNEREGAGSTPSELRGSETRRRYMFTTSGSFPILAQSPRVFAGAGKVVSVPHSTFVDLLTRYWPISPQEYTSTPHGIRTDLPLLPLATCLSPDEALFEVKDAQRVRWYLAVLACELSAFPGQLLARICHVAAPERPVNVLHQGALRLPERLGEFGSHTHFGIVRLAPLNEPWLVQLRVHTVFLEHPSRELPMSDMRRIRDARPDKTVTFTLPTWCRDALDMQGYAASLDRPREGGGGGSWRLILSPRPRTRSDSGLYRWSVTVDFSYEWTTPDADGLRIVAAAHIAGKDVQHKHTKRLEWRHTTHLTSIHPRYLEWQLYMNSSPWPFSGWHCRLMSSWLELVSESHEAVTLELGVQLVSASCYHIHADVVSELPAE